MFTALLNFIEFSIAFEKISFMTKSLTTNSKEVLFLVSIERLIQVDKEINFSIAFKLH